MQQVTLPWLIFRSTNSPAILGVAGFFIGLPAALVVLFAGVFADRGNPRRIVVATQLAWALLALVLALLVFLDITNVIAVMVPICILGIINGVDTPARQILAAHLANSQDQLASAFSFNSLSYDAARMLGPVLAGFVVAKSSESPVFLANALAHTLAMILLLSVQVQPEAIVVASQHNSRTTVENLQYAAHFRPVRSIILLSAVIGLAGSSYMVLLPVMATVLRGGPHTLGLLWSALGLGAIAGGLLLSTRRGVAGMAELIVIAVALFGAGILMFSLSRSLYLSLPALGIAGLGLMLMMASCNTVLLTITGSERHGRVLSLFTLAYMTTAPLGSLYIGFLASKTSAPMAVAVSGGISLLTAAVFLSQIPLLRQLVRSRQAMQRGSDESALE